MKVGAKVRPWSARGDAEERRDVIMRGLNQVLRARGTGALRMQDVADHLGLVKGNLYYYFKSKQDLIYRAHVKCVQVSLVALERAQAAPGSPEQRLHGLLVEHILALTEGDYSAVLLEDMEKLSGTRRRTYVALRDRFEQGIRELISAGIAAGQFAPQDARLAGFALLGSINWIPKWYRPGGAHSAQDIAQSFAALFMRALRA